jgi:hypothetical protein
MATKTKNPAVQLAISKLRIDAPYQAARRSTAILWAKKHQNNFRPELLGVIIVSYRDGAYWIVDGMARTFLSREGGGTHMWCVVYKGLTYEEEARRFVVLNKERRKTTAFQEFYGEHEARDVRVVSIVEVCKKYNYDILTESPGESVIRCYNQIRQITALPQGLDILDKVFEITRTSWASFGGTTHGDMFRGLAYFIQHHGDVPGVLGRLKETLFGVHPKTIHAEAYLRRGGNSGSGGYKMIYAIILEAYNKENSPKLASRLTTPLVRAPRKPPSMLSASLGDLFKSDVRGPGFLFCKGGAKVLAKRLTAFLGDRPAEQLGREASKVFRAYARGQRQKISPSFAALCELWGVAYRDLLIPKRAKVKAKAKARKAPTKRTKSNGNGNGHGKDVSGEVVFDATSSALAL